MSKAVANLTQLNETITFSAQDNGETINVKINELARGPAGADGPNSVTSATTSDGTANLSLSNVTTATATVTGTLTADHIHGNLAGSVYAHVRAGENLAKGDPVYISGSHGTGESLIAIVSLADAGDPLKMPAVGVMDAAVTANANGHMVITGTISDIDTSAFQVNDELYVNADPGPIDPRFTSTPPTALAQPVARVERANANNGAIIVKVNGLSASDATGNTLVRRTSTGGASFTSLSSTGLSVASGTITTSQPLSLTQTWNAGAVTFKGIDVNITDTSSASGSLLMDLRVGGVSKAKVYKNGSTFLNDIVFVNENEGRTLFLEGNDLAHKRFGTTYWRSNEAVPMLLRASGSLGWSSTTGQPLGSGDLFLSRDAANTLAQRNGTNAQESRVYGTYTSATNFERLNLKYNGTATAFQIGTEKGSAGGTARPLEFQTDGTTRMTIGATGLVTVNSISVNQSGNAVAAVITGENTLVDTIQIKGTSSASYASMGFIGADNSQKGSFGYGNPSAGAFANLVFFQAQTGIDAAFGAGAAERMRIKSGGNVGVGTSNPASRFTVTGGDVEVTDSTKGVILKSPDGTRYRITVANGGTLTVTAV